VKTSSKNPLLKLVAILAVFAMIAAACGTDSADTTEGTEAPVTTDAPAPDATDAPDTTDAPADPTMDAPEGTYAVGMTSDITTTNFWAYYNADGTVYNGYTLGITKPSMFAIEYPSISVVPLNASGLPAAPVEDGDTWTVTQGMLDNQKWSDGSSITANDVVFTFEAARDMGIGGTWLSAYPYNEEASPRLLDVIAVDDYTVTYVFDSKPGLGIWPHNIGTGPIMPEAAWGDAVAAAVASDDAVASIESADDSVDLSSGAFTLDTWEEGAFVVMNYNEHFIPQAHKAYSDGTIEIDGVQYYGSGGGDVTFDYSDGPFVSEATYSVQTDQAAAMLALENGENDFWITPLGVGTGLRQRGIDAPNLNFIANPNNGFRYVAFNTRKSPASYLGFRQATAYMIDKEFLTQNVLQGAAIPLYTYVPQGNSRWYDADIAASISERYVGLSESDRVTLAVEALKADGFTWAVEPTVDEDGVITNGAGIVDPEGVTVPDLEILAPPASYDPLRATAALWIEGWLEIIGVTSHATPTDFNTIVAAIWPGVGEEIPFDMYILGWGLGNPALPTFHESFWHSRNLAETNDGNNSTGFINAEFDAAADAILAAETEDEAKVLIWEAEKILADELPYVVLFTTPVVEFYSTGVNYPYTSVLGGLQQVSGLPANAAK
jgi:peptide/nickel transport system substrate-binding protein